MENTFLKKIALADDFKATRLTELIGEMIIESGISAARLYGAAADDFKSAISLNTISNLLSKAGGEPVPESDAVSMARGTLVLLANDETFAPVLSAAFEKYEEDDNRLFAGIILSTGAVMTLLMLVAATEFEIKGKNWFVRKNQVSAAQIKAIKEMMPSLLKKENNE